MRAVLWVLGLFALAVAITLAARVDQGYVLIVFPPWRIELSFVLALFLNLALFGVGYVGVRVLRLTLRLPADVRAWRQRRRSDKAEDELSRAISALISGQPAHALRLARATLDREPRPLAALVAAQAALELGDRHAAGELLKGVREDVGELIAARQAIEVRLAAPEHPSPPAAGA